MTKASENQYPKVTFAESAAPGTPSAGLAYVYVNTGGTPFFVDDAGTETSIIAGGSGIEDMGTFTYLDAAEQSSTGTPASGYVRLYAKTDGRIYSTDDTGTEYGPFDAAGSGTATWAVISGTPTTTSGGYDYWVYHVDGSATIDTAIIEVLLHSRGLH